MRSGRRFNRASELTPRSPPAKIRCNHNSTGRGVHPWAWTGVAKHRTYLIEFKRQVVQDYLGGERLYGLAKRHEISRTLICVGPRQARAGVLDSDGDITPRLRGGRL